MKRMTLIISLVGLALVLTLLPTQADSAPELDYQQSYQLGYDAYVYGLPLLEFNRVRASNLKEVKVNQLINAQRPADASSRQVVAPNVDTLYSIAQIDLAKGPVVLNVPAMGSRYRSFQLLDPYTNSIAYFGNKSKRKESWTIEWKKSKAPLPRGAKRITTKSRRVWMIGRTLINNNLNQARRDMDRYSLTARSAFQKGKRGKPKRGELSRPGQQLPKGIAFLGALHRALITDPPPVADKEIINRLNQVYYGTNRAPHVSGLPSEIMRGLADGVNQATSELPQAAKLSIFEAALTNGGWYIPAKNIGNYGQDYLFRARVALLGLGANRIEQAAYSLAISDSQGRLLTGTKSYRLHFASEPPAQAFWSLTIYDDQGYLVDNSDDIYAIGPTHQGFVRNPDQSVTIIIAAKRPEGNSLNWLPAPSANFRLNLRIYQPGPSVINQSWRPPSIEELN